jgi:hypothetical protein
MTESLAAIKVKLNPYFRDCNRVEFSRWPTFVATKTLGKACVPMLKEVVAEANSNEHGRCTLRVLAFWGNSLDTSRLAAF